MNYRLRIYAFLLLAAVFPAGAILLPARAAFLPADKAPRAEGETGIPAAGDTISVYFPLNIRSLTNEEIRKLDSLQYANILHSGKEIRIVGYADYLGSGLYNDTLSLDRAREVQRYLLASGFKKDRIRLCVGKGAVSREGPADPEGSPTDRRVDIVMARRTSARPPVPDQAPAPASIPPPASPLPSPVSTAISAPPLNPTRASLTPTPASVPIRRLDDIHSAEVDESILLNDIFFPPNSHFATAESGSQLDYLVNVLRTTPSLRIRIEGHICCVTQFPDAYDEDSGDYRLSLNRAFFIYQYLISKGIPRERLRYAGYGRSRPVIPVERTEEDGERNRRVEIRILSK